MHVEVARVSFDQTRQLVEQGESAAAADRVEAARALQRARCNVANAQLGHRALIDAVALAESGAALLARAAERWKLSARSSDRVLRVARTIADLAGERVVSKPHVAEAIQLRCLDRPL